MRGLHAFLARPAGGSAHADASHAGTSHPADAIFVFAGNQERKSFAVERWRAGAARTLVVSVGRFEWRRFPSLGLPDGGLRDLVAETPYWRRHFFVEVGHDGARARFVGMRPFGTRHEARALASLMREHGWDTAVIVTSAVHVRRASLALARATRGMAATFSYEPVPPDRDPYSADRWWRTRRGLRVVLSEVVKLTIYASLLWR